MNRSCASLAIGAAMLVAATTILSSAPANVTTPLKKPKPVAHPAGNVPHPIATGHPAEPDTHDLPPQEAQRLLEEDWLFQAEGKPLAARALEEINWARALADRLSRHPQPPDLKTQRLQLDTLETQLKALPPKGNPAEAQRLYLMVRQVKREIVFKNPVIDFTRLLFVDNPFPEGSEWAHEARHRNGFMAVPGGRLLVLEGLHPGGKLRKLAPDNGHPASFWRPDLSFDATKVLFCMKPDGEKAFHLYEMNLDGTGRRQLTRGDYDDMDPIYVPDGHIVFVSGRSNTYVRCMPYTQTFVLARCDSDGGNVYLISVNNEPEYMPALMNDGRILYTRWEYNDKALWRVQSLWTVNPDGSNVSVFWGNQSVWPDVQAEARSIPGSHRVLFTGTAHHGWFSGCIGILDPRKGRDFPDGLTKVTADVAWPESGNGPVDPREAADYHTAGRFAAWKAPYPLGEEDFIVSGRREGKEAQFALYMMDVHGNRELIYRGQYNSWYAMPVRPRPVPTAIPDRVAWPGTGKDRKPVQPGVFYSANVFEGTAKAMQGKAKFLRVVHMESKTYSTWYKLWMHEGPAVSAIQADGVKRILGTVPIEADGSVSFVAPAGKALYFQLLDDQYRALQSMRSFTGLMPAEQRGCVGCHEQHSTSPSNYLGLAAQRAPTPLTPPPWGTQSISYQRFCQPVLDKHCARCHQGEGPARAKLDMTYRPSNVKYWPKGSYQDPDPIRAVSPFAEPYLTLVGGAAGFGQLRQGVNTDRKPAAGCFLMEAYGKNDPASLQTVPPFRYYSYVSKLVENAASGKHNGVRVTGEDLLRLMAWVDMNCPYLGSEEIRQMPDPDFPNIEMIPIRPRVKTAPDIERP